MKSCYLVCYDIREPKRLRNVYRVMKSYGESWQYSVFFCALKDIDRVRMQSDLEEEINLREDQVMILGLTGDEETVRKNLIVLGQALPGPDKSIIVI